MKKTSSAQLIRTSKVCEIRILIPDGYWTPIPWEVFTHKLSRLSSLRVAVVYLVLLDRANHSKRQGEVAASIAKISNWAKVDRRVVAECIEELRDHGMVLIVSAGTPRSRSDPPRYQVPLGSHDLRKGAWVPVPRFLIQEYCTAYHPAVVLLLFLATQTIRSRDDCYVGKQKLSERLNCSQQTVYRAIRRMGHTWEKKFKKLPQPLAITYAHKGTKDERRHYSVRAVVFIRKKGKPPKMLLAPEFKKHFKIPGTFSSEKTS